MSARTSLRSLRRNTVTRHTWEVPLQRALKTHHPLTDEPLWKLILRRVEQPVSDSASFPDIVQRARRHWPVFLEYLSRWELRRYFNRHQKSVVLKPKADFVVLHPVGRFPSALTDAQWKDACFWALLAHCNHGKQCKNTFRDAAHLATFEDDTVAELMRRFVTSSSEERTAKRMAPCPPHVAKAWHLGMARRERAAEKLLPTSRVTNSLHNVKYAFAQTQETWQQMLWEDTTADNQAGASQAWKKAELPPGSASAEGKTEAEVVAEEEDAAIGNAMAALTRKDFK